MHYEIYVTLTNCFNCLSQVVDIIKSHPDHDIIIGIDSLGKEDLLLHISRMLNIKVCRNIVIENISFLAIT